MSPLPQNLPKECRKAEKILKSFMEPTRNGLDGVIPREVLANAKGFVIFTVVKAGFVFSARAGSGIVIARLPDGSWSAPSAIGTAGMGFGGQAGAEMTEFLIVLNSQSALKSFMSAGSLTIGGNLSVAVGPLGRNAEATGSLNTKGKLAAMYSYSKTKGLFGGISVEGSVILERQDANCIAYEDDHITSKKLLMGVVPVPPWASGLVEALDRAAGNIKGWVEEERPRSTSIDEYAFGSASGVSSEKRPKLKSGLFGGSSSSSVRKAMSNPLVGPSKRSNIADKYLDTPRKSYEGGIMGRNSMDDEEDAGYGTRSSFDQTPFSHTDALKRPVPHKASSSNTLFSEPFARTDGDESKGRFATHFDSDFDPRAPTPQTLNETHTRNSASISSTRSGNGLNWLIPQETTILPVATGAYRNNPDDPFGIFSEEPTTAPLPPNLAYSGNFSRSATHASIPSYDRSTPALSMSGQSPPSSPTYSQHQHDQYNYNSGVSSPKPVRQLSVKRGLKTPIEDGVERAVALYDFNAQEAGDLAFRKGDVIIVTKKTDTADDWWTGRIETPSRREGIFPANFVDLV